MDDGIYLYHFTAIDNLPSIRKLGGLFSWRYMRDQELIIPKPGGNDFSRRLDVNSRFGDLSDYVRLSFCRDHPMANRLRREGYRLVLLKIDTSIVNETSYIANKNAADSTVSIIPAIDFFEKIDFMDFLDFDSIHHSGPIEYGGHMYKAHQAEVLIKRHVPLEFINNIENPERF